MVKQEEATTDLQKTTKEIKGWMAKQDETSSEIKNILMTLLSKNS